LEVGVVACPCKTGREKTCEKMKEGKGVGGEEGNEAERGGGSQ